MEKSKKSILGIGISSILLIFILLCLVTFAVLSLVSANSDYKLSRKNADHIKEYYEAECVANDRLLQINTCLEEQYLLYGNTPEYFKAAAGSLTKDDISFLSEKELAFQVSAGKKQILCVTLELLSSPDQDGYYYTIKGWNTKSSEAWEPDQHLPVYQGEENETGSGQ